MSNYLAVTKRLTPLYVAAFFQGFVLWYPIEKIFMRSIGFDDATIGITIAAYSAIMLLAETPSGILADRWSRKGVLILASVFLGLASLIGGSSDALPMYIIASLMWGVFFAMYTGTYDSIVYDTLFEETGSSKKFEFFYGRVKVYDSVALVISSLLGGLVANSLGFRVAYFLTIPAAFFAVLALLRFKEPKLHKAKEGVPIKEQIAMTLSAVTKNKYILPVVLTLIFNGVLTYTVLEFSQLWYIALDAPVAIYGFANAILLTAFGLGAVVTGRYKVYRSTILIPILLAMGISLLGLLFVKNIYVVIACLFCLTVGIFSISVLFNRILHDSLESNIRAGASSAISTFSRILVIPTVILVGYLSQTFDIFRAAWVICVIFCFVVLFIYKSAQRNSKKGLYPKS